MNTEIPQKPFVLVLDPTRTFAPILKTILYREGHEVEIIAFHQPDMALFWLSGEMDRRKGDYPFTSPWDNYPMLKPPTLAIVSLAFPAEQCHRILSLFLLQEPRPSLFTTSTKEELSTNQSQEYWRHIVSHIPQPLKVADVLERLTPFL